MASWFHDNLDEPDSFEFIEAPKNMYERRIYWNSAEIVPSLPGTASAASARMPPSKVITNHRDGRSALAYS